MTTSFQFLLKDAHRPESARKFVQALVDTGKFSRNEKSTICFEVDKNDHTYVVRKQDLTAILQDGIALKITGDVAGADCFDTLWMWATARKHLLPLLNPHKPYNPDAP